MRVRRVALGLAALLFAGGASAAARTSLPTVPPHYLKLQSGGELGFATLGLGYAAFDERLTIAGYVGWVPAVLGGKTIVTPAFAVSYRPWAVRLPGEGRWWPLYGGLGGLFGTGGRFPVFTDEVFPPPGLRVLAHFGTEYRFPTSPTTALVTHGVFAEVTAVDQYLLLWLRNDVGMSFGQVWSGTLGYKAWF